LIALLNFVVFLKKCNATVIKKQTNALLEKAI